MSHYIMLCDKLRRDLKFTKSDREGPMLNTTKVKEIMSSAEYKDIFIQTNLDQMQYRVDSGVGQKHPLIKILIYCDWWHGDIFISIISKYKFPLSLVEESYLFEHIWQDRIILDAFLLHYTDTEKISLLTGMFSIIFSSVKYIDTITYLYISYHVVIMRIINEHICCPELLAKLGEFIRWRSRYCWISSCIDLAMADS